jgi:F-type H+/Na+-transporting ATPase subunit alpha
MDQINQYPPTNSQKSPKPNSAQEVGYVVNITNYIIWVEGLPNIKINEIVISQNNARGIVYSIQNDLVEILMLDDIKVKPQEMFVRTYKQFSIKVGPHYLGRAISVLGSPIDGKAGFGSLGQSEEINKTAPGIKTREIINTQFETGVTLIDMLIPIAYGQRELMMGDAHSGKTGFLFDLLSNQKGKNMVCVYAVIGKPINEIKNILNILAANQITPYTVVIAAASSEKAPLIYLAPSIATTVAEYFQKQGRDVLLILDDLGLHAKFYREISLLSGNPPGRDSYPGDIFFQHAKLIERAGRFNSSFGGGSITAIPVIETHLDDFTSYMTTNLMAMTDGHILFSSLKYKTGVRPAIDISISVSRVGRQTQYLAQKILSDRIKAVLAEAKKLEAVSRIGSEVSSQTLAVLKQSKQIEIILNQGQLVKMPIPIQIILLALTFTPFLTQKDAIFVQRNLNLIIDYLFKNIDINSYHNALRQFKSDKELIDSLSNYITNLEKICK